MQCQFEDFTLAIMSLGTIISHLYRQSLINGFHPQLVQNQSSHKGRPIGAQSSVTQNAMVLPDKRCTESRDGLQFAKIR
jgi:hypothetical protein